MDAFLPYISPSEIELLCTHSDCESVKRSEDSPDSSCDGSTYLFGRYWVSEMPLSSSERFRKVRVT